MGDGDTPASEADELLRSDLGRHARPATYVLSAAVYLERDGEILLLKRAVGGAMAGQWFLPGGMVEEGELPEEGARRELVEEAGIDVDGELEIVGAYPMFIYGHDTLQVTYRGAAAPGEPQVSAEHDGARWVDPVRMRAALTDDAIEAIARGHEPVRDMVRHIRTDLDRYLQRAGR